MEETGGATWESNPPRTGSPPRRRFWSARTLVTGRVPAYPAHPTPPPSLAIHSQSPTRLVLALASWLCGFDDPIRKQRYSTGYVLIDAVDIFLSLSRGEFSPFPDGLQEPMDLIGRLVTRRALSERRNTVTAVIGSEAEPAQRLLDALRSIGHGVRGALVTCDSEEALRRNASRGNDDIPSANGGQGRRGAGRLDRAFVRHLLRLTLLLEDRLRRFPHRRQGERHGYSAALRPAGGVLVAHLF
jgi:hypothetical protein